MNTFPLKRLSKEKAADLVETWDQMSDMEFDGLLEGWRRYEVENVPEEYRKLRNRIIETYRETLPLIKTSWYPVDLAVGLVLYEELYPGNGFIAVQAGDDDFWRFLSCYVFPDITFLRFESKKASGQVRINKKRFYSHPRRIWVKTLWWYIHLAWQGDREKTYEVLKDFGADTISDLIERTGRGYRPPLTRAIMWRFSQEENRTTARFNHIQKQNLVNCRNVEPALTQHGEMGYAADLLQEVKE